MVLCKLVLPPRQALYFSLYVGRIKALSTEPDSALPAKLRGTLPNAGDGVQSLGREDPLEEGMATHSSILAWEIV